MSAEALDHVFKILLIGDAGVGKSRWEYLSFSGHDFFDSILLQFTDGYFNDNLQSTIGTIICFFEFIHFCLGVDFKVKVMDVAGPDGRPKRVKVTIWDTGYIAPFILLNVI